jgi:hypothetical protein
VAPARQTSAINFFIFFSLSPPEVSPDLDIILDVRHTNGRRNFQ